MSSALRLLTSHAEISLVNIAAKRPISPGAPNSMHHGHESGISLSDSLKFMGELAKVGDGSSKE
jgi:hypothetical protein